MYQFLFDSQKSKEVLFTKLDVDVIADDEQSSQMQEVMENLRSDSSKSAGGKTKEDLERIVERNSEALLQKDVLLQENSEKLGAVEKHVCNFDNFVVFFYVFKLWLICYNF